MDGRKDLWLAGLIVPLRVVSYPLALSNYAYPKNCTLLPHHEQYISSP